MIDTTEFITNSFLPRKIYSGIQLKEILGLAEYRYVWIKKVFNVSIPMYIIILNTKYPNLYIPRSKVKHTNAFSVSRTDKVVNQTLKDYSTSEPVIIDDYTKRISSRSIIIKYDIAGEYYTELEN